MHPTTYYSASKTYRLVRQTVYESGYVDSQATTALMGLRKDDRGLSSLTCNDRSDGRANRLLNYRATTAKAKKPNEEPSFL
jgi:hypothetical protein